MGKIARVAAHVKNVTADPVATGVLYTGRGIKFGAFKVKHVASNAVKAVKIEEARIEQERAAKKTQDLADLVAEVESLKATATATATATKPSKPSKPRSSTTKTKVSPA